VLAQIEIPRSVENTLEGALEGGGDGILGRTKGWGARGCIADLLLLRNRQKKAVRMINGLGSGGCSMLLWVRIGEQIRHIRHGSIC
jgi:hypothetical protein